MLQVNNLTFTYGRRQWPVIRDLSLEVKPGGVYGLLGKNGVGKSTLLYLMAGLLAPFKGEVLLNGVNTRRREPSTLADIFLMPEEIVLPSTSLIEYVKINAPFYPRFSHEDMDRHIATFGLSGDVNLGELSMGQKRKVFISFAMACNTSLLLMDEPTNGLDIPGKEEFRSFLAGSVGEERAVIVSTHQVRDIDRLLDHVIIMDDSKVVFNHSMEEICSCLKFALADSPEMAKNALYSRPAIGGTEVIIPNEDGGETEVDIEMLFNIAITNPGLLEHYFRTV